MASLQDTSLEEECFTQALQQQQESRNTAAALPLTHEAAMKWFYKDPQGEIQGKLEHIGVCSVLVIYIRFVLSYYFGGYIFDLN